MDHKNFANLDFTKIPYQGRSVPYAGPTSGGRLKQPVPPWSFYAPVSYDYGKTFFVEIPKSIEPMIVVGEFKKKTLILPPDSFNVILPFQIIPKVRDQKGTLIFGQVDGGFTTLLHGAELILKRENFSNYALHFVAVLHKGEHIAIRRQGSVRISYRHGNPDEAWVFSREKLAILPFNQYHGYINEDPDIEDPDKLTFA